MLHTQFYNYNLKIFTMKHLYKLAYVLFIGVFISSCAIDDDPAVVAQSSAEGNIIEFLQTGTINYPTGGDLLVRMNKPSVTASQVVYKTTQTNTDGSVTMLEEGVVKFPPGATEAIMNIDVPFLETVTVTLSKPIGINNPTIELGGNDTLDLVGLLSPSPDSIELAFTNQGDFANIWFGLSQFTTSGGWIADYHQNSSGGSPRFMSIPLDGAGELGTIPNTSDVEPNMLALNLFTQAVLPNDPHEFKIYVTMPDGSTQEFEGTIPAATSTDNAVVKVTIEDDPNSPGNKTYVFSEL